MLKLGDMKINEYLHYGVFIQSERVAIGDNPKKRSKSAGFKEDEESYEGMKMVPVRNINRTIEDIVNEYGLSVAFVVRRRIYSLPFLLNSESHFKLMSDKEIDLLFTQLFQENITYLAYNEEGVAIKQAAILESLLIMRQRFIGSIAIKGFFDKKVQEERVDIRFLHTVYPSHLLTFFNKKTIWKRIADAKQDLPFNSTAR